MCSRRSPIANRERSGRIGTLGTAVGDTTLPPVHTTPEATELQASLARMRDAGVGTVAMEVSSHALEQHRVDGTHFAAVCFTNLSHDHLDYHGTMEEYFEAKARLFDERVRDAGRDLARRSARSTCWQRARRRPASTSGRSRSTTRPPMSHARDVDTDAGRDAVHARVDVATTRPRPSSRGTAARTGSTSRTCSRRRRRHGPAGFRGTPSSPASPRPCIVPGRFEPVDAGQGSRVLVDYAHTPDALERVLVAARPLAAPGGAVVGRVRLRRRPGPRQAAADGRGRGAASPTAPISRPTTLVPKIPAAIVADVLAGVPADASPPLVARWWSSTAGGRSRAAVAEANAGDVVVIAGKGHETGQIVARRDAPVRRPRRRP